MSWKGVITNAGQALLDVWSQGGHVLTIDGATVGSGYVEDANMRIATGLSHYEADASIVGSEAIENGTKFKVQVPPAATTAYTAHEVGLWAHLDSGQSTLLALHQDSDAGIGVPTAAESPDFAFALYLIHAVSNNDSLVVNIDPNAFVSMRSFNSAVSDLEDADTALGNSIGALQGDVSDLEDADEALENAVSGLRGDVSGLQGAVSGLQGDVSDLETDVDNLDDRIDAVIGRMVSVNLGTISSLPVTKTVNGVTADMVVLESTLGTPSAQTGDWTVTTGSNSITVAGTISGSTTLSLILGTPVVKTVS